MLEVYGRVFRRQEQSRPWWWAALIVVGIIFGLLWLTMISYNIGCFALWCLKSQAEANQLATARLVGFLFGALALWIYTGAWRQRLFLSAPIRDLASTPGTAWQVFRVALRMKWWDILSVPTVLFAVALLPWFNEAVKNLSGSLAWASADDPQWEWAVDALKHFGWLLSGLGAVIAMLMLHGVFSVTAIAINLVVSGLGLGGLAPRSALLGRLIQCVVWFSAVLGVVAFVSTIGFWVAQPPEPPGPEWWRLGRWCDSVFSGGDGFSDWIRWFPGVAFGEVLYGLALTDTSVAPNWFSLLAWGGGAVALACVAFRSGFSHTVRCGLDREVPVAAPADAGRTERRAFNPDRVNGPLERLLVAWLGRMGRAVLRLVTANAQSGAIDRVLIRTLIISAFAVAFGRASMWLVPKGIAAFLNLHGIPFDERDEQVIGDIIAVTVLAGLTVYCILVWGGPRVLRSGIGAQAVSRDAQSGGMAGSWSRLFRRRKATTRGDQRYPLSEIYAVGFSDAVLVPTLYAAFWLSATAAMIWVTGLLFGLSVSGLNWSVAIGLPALLEFTFLSNVGMSWSYWTHYRRSLLYHVLLAVWFGVLAVAGFMAVLALIVWVWVASHKAEHPYWVPWLGTLNILLVANVSCYMLVRALYVRRRFDAEYRDPTSLA